MEPLLAYIKECFKKKGHAVVCLAEGAGQVGVCSCVCGCVWGREGAGQVGNRMHAHAHSLHMHIVPSPYAYDTLPHYLPSPALHTQDLVAANGGADGRDASGNPILKDIGLWLKAEINKAFKASGKRGVGVYRWQCGWQR
jgi:hypothetical protein